MKKYVNKYSISFFVMFTIIMLAASFLISIYDTTQYDMRYDNYLLSQNAKILSITQTNISQEDLLNSIFTEPNIYIKGATLYEDNNNDRGTIIFFNYDLDTTYPMVEGDFITKEDCLNSEKVAVIGKNIVKDTYLKEGKRYIKVENKEYFLGAKVQKVQQPMNLVTHIHILYTIDAIAKNVPCDYYHSDFQSSRNPHYI